MSARRSTPARLRTRRWALRLAVALAALSGAGTWAADAAPATPPAQASTAAPASTEAKPAPAPTTASKRATHSDSAASVRAEVPTPRVRWQFPTGARIVGAPAWAGGGRVVVASDDGHLYAVDAASGRERWRYATGGPVSSSPAVADGRVVVLSYDGRLHAVDAATGAPLWKYATGGERRFEARGLHGMRPRQQTFADPYDVYLSSPVVVQGVVYVGSSDGHVHAVDAADGRARWRRKLSDDVLHATPALADGRLFIGGFDGRFHALDAASGEPLWQHQAGVDPLMANQQGFQSSAVVHGGTVYTGCRDAHVYAFDAASGALKWSFPTGASWVNSTPAVHGGRVHFATSDTALLHAVDAATGAPLWQQPGPAYMFAPPVVADGLLLQGVLNGSLQARDPATGTLVWEFQTEASRRNAGWALTATRGLNSTMLFPNGWHDTMAIGAARQYAVGAFFGAPLVVGTTIFVGSADGRLYALQRPR